MLENKLFEALLDVIPFGAYAVDTETYELIYANKIVRENMYAPQETYCWEQIYGREEICPWCSVYQLKNREQNQSNEENQSCEFFDEMDDKWIKSYDELISWPDGRSVKYSILVDINDQKSIQGSMIQSHAKLAVKTKQIKKTNKNLQITKLKLQKSVNEFEQLFNSTLEGIMIIQDDICIDINEQAKILLHYREKDQLVGKNIYDLIYMEDGLACNLNTIEDIKTFEAQCVDKNGEKFPALVKITQLQSRNSLLVSFVDLSELKKKDKIISNQLRMSSLEELIKNISHHWRQPLSLISTCASGMKLKSDLNTLDEKEIALFCDQIDESTKFLSKTINSFSDFVIGDFTQKEFSLNESIEKFKNMTNLSAEANMVTIVYQLEDDEVKLLGSPNDLTQCFLNIFNNSVDILMKNNKEEDRFIFFSQAIKEDKIIISIKDNGGGVKEEDVDKIFEPYFTTKHQTQGSGLGLHMAYNLISKKLNGFIEANNIEYNYENKQYKGCDITIELPLLNS